MYIDKNKEMRVCVFYLFSNENVVYQLNISMQIDMPHLILSESQDFCSNNPSLP